MSPIHMSVIVILCDNGPACTCMAIMWLYCEDLRDSFQEIKYGLIYLLMCFELYVCVAYFSYVYMQCTLILSISVFHIFPFSLMKYWLVWRRIYVYVYEYDLNSRHWTSNLYIYWRVYIYIYIYIYIWVWVYMIMYLPTCIKLPSFGHGDFVIHFEFWILSLFMC